ncbi:MAG: SCP2 sterol-binding domain-containing protein [Acidimicrobiales bacterium]
MSDFLSPQWVRELAEAAAASQPLRAATAGIRLTVHHHITGGPSGDVDYRVRFANGEVEVVPGPGEADVAVEQAYPTAAAISRGELSPAEAFADGRVRLGGQPGLLANHREALAQLEDVFAGVRARTQY